MSMSVDGLVSGMDTTSLITQLIQAEAGPQTALKSRLSTTQLAASAYRTVNTTFAAVRAAAETVLVVEDEAMVCELTAEALLDEGYRVLTAADADAAENRALPSDFYARLAAHWKRAYAPHPAGWTAWVLSPDMKLPSAMRLNEARRMPMWNGPLECRLFRFDLIAGSARAPRDDAAA